MTTLSTVRDCPLVALLTVACLRSAPARWRLRATLGALFVTTLPWTLLPAIPIKVASGPSPILDILPLDAPLVTPDVGALAASTIPTEAWQFPLVVVLSAASGLGLAAFALLVLRQRSTLRRWRAMAQDGDHLLGEVPRPLRNCRVRILPRGSQATATGILRPTVWIGQQHLDDERRSSILLHELMHLHRRHPQIAVAMTFLRCVFWWQPFVWLWIWLARRELEHDCDEACAEILGRDCYRTTLASLIHDAVPQPGLALMGRRSFNFRRIEQLEKLRSLSLRHRVATTVAMCVTPVACPRHFRRSEGRRWSDPRRDRGESRAGCPSRWRWDSRPRRDGRVVRDDRRWPDRLLFPHEPSGSPSASRRHRLATHLPPPGRRHTPQSEVDGRRRLRRGCPSRRRTRGPDREHLSHRRRRRRRAVAHDARLD